VLDIAAFSLLNFPNAKTLAKLGGRFATVIMLIGPPGIVRQLVY
jgi:hypothetical protein